MAKRIIRLTESDLHKIIKESVKRALNEARPSAKELLNRYHKGPWGDWRDEYDAYWDSHFDDPRREDLEKAARNAVVRDFGGFTPEYFKALRRHEAYRDAYHPFLSPSGREGREKMDREYDEKYGFNPGEDEEDDYARLSRFLPGEGEEGGQKKQRARRGSNLSRVKAAPTYRQQQPNDDEYSLNQGSGMSLEDIEAKMRELGFAK
jgi:hypothetical protein